MAANGKITAQDTIESAQIIAQFKAIDEAAVKLLNTFSQLQKIGANIKTPKQGNDVLERQNNLQKEGLGIVKERTRLGLALKSSLNKEKLALSNANKELIKSRTETNRLNKSIRDSATITSTTISFYKRTSTALNVLRDSYKSLEARKQLGIKLSKQEQAEYQRLRQRVLQLNQALVKADAAAGQFNRNVGNYPRGLRLAAGALRSFAGAFGFTSGIFLFAAAIKDALNRVREFDKAMQNIAGVLRTSREDIADLEAEIIRVAGSSIKTSREVAGLTESLVTLGKSKEEIKDLLEPVNDLGIALNTTGDKAAEFLVQTLNAFGAGSDEASEYADIIATIRTSTTLDFQRMADSFQYLTPISRILNKDLAYTGAIIGVLADNGLKAEQGARLLGTAQQKLAKQNISLVDALEQINDAQAQGVKELDLLALASDLFGKQAAKVGVILANNSDRLEENAQAIRDNGGALDDLVNEQLKSLDANLKILDSTWEEYILTVENGNGTIANGFKEQIQGLTAIIGLMTELEKASSKVNTITSNIGNSFLDRIDSSPIFFGLLNTEYDNLIELQREFNRVAENVDANGIEILRLEYDRLNKILDENEDLTISQRELYREQSKVLEQAIITKKVEREELEATAIAYGFNEKELGRYADSIELYTNGDLEDFINANERLAKSLKEVKNEFSTDFVTLGRLREELKQLREEYEKTEINTPEFFAFQKEIEELEKRIRDLDATRKKSSKETRKIIEGSVAAYQKIISELKEEQATLATSNESYQEYQDQIEEAELKVLQLTRALDSLNKVQGAQEFRFSTAGIVTAPTTNETQDDFIEAAALAEIRQEAQKQEVLKALRQGGLDDYKNLTDEQVSTVEGAILLEQKLREDLAESTRNLAYDLSDSITELRVQAVDEEIEANNKRYDSLRETLEAQGATEEQLLAAKKQFEKRDEELQRKKEKREKQGFLISQGLALAEVALKLAQTIAAINLAAAELDAVSLGSAGQIYRATNIPIAITTAGIQTASILAQSIPAFFKGKEESNKYQGLATWNEKRPEVNVDKDGNVMFGKTKNELRYVSPEDIIHKSVPDFHAALRDPSTTTYQRIASSLNREHEFRTKMVVVQGNDSTLTTDQLEKVIRTETRKQTSALKGALKIRANRIQHSNRF